MDIPVSYFISSLRKLGMLSKFIENDTLAWLLLVVITLVSWFLSEEVTTAGAVMVVVVLSSIKVLVIGFSYMEIQRSKKAFYRFYLLWVILVSCVVLLFQSLFF